MTNEELLKPRYIVIADYPGKYVKVGRIFKSDIGEYYDRFPAIFRKLEWWEDRKPEDMPKYVKLVIAGKTQYVHRALDWGRMNCNGHPLYDYYNRVGTLMSSCVADLLPATEAEYLEYINSKK